MPTYDAEVFAPFPVRAITLVEIFANKVVALSKADRNLCKTLAYRNLKVLF